MRAQLFSILLFSVLLLAGCTVVPGQAKIAPPSAGFARIYVYRLDYDPRIYNAVLNRTLPVKFAGAGSAAEQELPTVAGLKNKRYFVMDLAPGKYQFDTRMMQGRLDLELAAGDVRYVRVDVGVECASDEDPCDHRPSSIVVMDRPAALGELPKVKPVSRGSVNDRNLVIIPEE